MYNETHLEEFIQLLKLPAYILKLPLDDPKQVNTDRPWIFLPSMPPRLPAISAFHLRFIIYYFHVKKIIC